MNGADGSGRWGRRLGSPLVDTDLGRGSVGLRAAAVIGVLAATGVATGLVWWLLWEPSYYVVTDGHGAMAEPDLGRRFDADGWFAVIGTAAGLLSGALVTWRFRSDRLVSLAALVLGSFAAVGAMRLTGALLGPADADRALASAAEGARVPVELGVTVPGFHLAWPVAALFAACAVLWSGSDRDERREHLSSGSSTDRSVA